MKSDKNLDNETEKKSLLHFFWKLLTNNFELKLISFVFALLLFFVVRTDRETVIEKTGHIKIITSPKMAVLGSRDRFVNLNIRLRNSIFGVEPTSEDLTGELQIINEKPGRSTYHISRDNFPRLPQYYEVIIDKPFVDVELDYMAQKSLEVVPIVTGKPGKDKMYTGSQISPQYVTVFGPQQEINHISFVKTFPISIQSMSKTETMDVGLDLDDRNDLTAEPDIVRTTVNIGQKKNTKLFAKIPIRLSGISYNASKFVDVRPKFVQVEFYGMQKELKKINRRSFSVSLDAGNLLPGWQDKALNVKAPDTVKVLRITPRVVSVFYDDQYSQREEQ